MLSRILWDFKKKKGGGGANSNLKPVLTKPNYSIGQTPPPPPPQFATLDPEPVGRSEEKSTGQGISKD